MSVKDCCKREENLEKLESYHADQVVHKCRVCGCRHFRMIVDPGRFQLKFDAD